MQYYVVKGLNFEEFIKNVNAALEKGLVLQGGISTCSDTNLVTTYYQAFSSK